MELPLDGRLSFQANDFFQWRWDKAARPMGAYSAASRITQLDFHFVRIWIADRLAPNTNGCIGTICDRHDEDGSILRPTGAKGNLYSAGRVGLQDFRLP